MSPEEIDAKAEQIFSPDVLNGKLLDPVCSLLYHKSEIHCNLIAL